jgi:hypothetical protein
MIATCGLLLAIAHGFRERIYCVNDLSQVPLRLTRRGMVKRNGVTKVSQCIHWD